MDANTNSCLSEFILVSCKYPLSGKSRISFQTLDQQRGCFLLAVPKLLTWNYFFFYYCKAGTSAEYQALLAEIKQKDKQREELLMNLKVSVVSKFGRGHRAKINISWF